MAVTRSLCRRTPLLVAALLVSSCGPGPPVPVKAPETDVPSAGQFPHAMLTRLLGEAVAPDGLVDYAAADRQKDLLDLYLGEVARISPLGQPHLFPTVEDQLAYWINAQNAAALKGVLVLGRPADLSRLGRRLDEMTFLFGGRRLSLLGVVGIVREQFPDPRPFLVMARGRRGGPPLAREAFEPKDVEERLETLARAFMKNPRYVAWAAGSATVSVSPVILGERSQFEKLEPATVQGDERLIEAINHFLPGREWILAKRVLPLPMDERLNDVSNR